VTDFDSMPAGAEMDSLVAERVMGWRYEHHSYWGKGSTVIFDPSRSISDAWRVVEHAQTLSVGGQRIRTVVIEMEKGIATVRLDTYSETAGWAVAESAPLAICRAALKALA
jgi:hypothetical protein